MSPSPADRRRTVVDILAEALLRLNTDRESSQDSPSGVSKRATREK